jgi:membrane-associated phospholipid phosphatase
VSKVAFLGFGLGIAALDFTGFSGHSMYAASVEIPLLATCALALCGRGRWVGAMLGTALAALIAVSRVEVGAHSVSEAIAGFVLGGSLAAWVVAPCPGSGPPSRPCAPPWAWPRWAWSCGWPRAWPGRRRRSPIRWWSACPWPCREHPYTRAHLHPQGPLACAHLAPAGETDLA